MPRKSEMRWGAALCQAARFGLSPAEFWRLSLSEWRMLTAQAPGAAMPRADLDRLRNQFPDDTP